MRIGKQGMNNDRFSDIDDDVELSEAPSQTADKLLSEVENAPVPTTGQKLSESLGFPRLTLFDSSAEQSNNNDGDNNGGAEKVAAANGPVDTSAEERDGEPGTEEKSVAGDVQKPSTEANDTNKTSTTLRFGRTELRIDIPVGGEYILERGKDGIFFPGMSKRHAIIGRDEKGLYIQDLSSTNGTHVVTDKGSKERPLAPNEKVYLADVVSLRFANSPVLDGGKAPKVEPLNLAGQQVAHPDKFQQDLTKGEIVGAPSLKRGGNSMHEKYTAQIKTEDGTTYNVYLRHMNQALAVTRMRKELAAYELNKMLGFDNGFPPTSVRRFEVNGEQKFGSVQISAGEDFNQEIEAKLGGNKDIPTLMREDPKLRREIEQAFLERLIYGDHDPHGENFRLVARRNGGVSVVSIDLDQAFAKNEAPIMVASSNQGVNEDLFKHFSNAPISKEFRDKLDNFVKQYDNEEGRKQLKALGLSGTEVDALLSRVRWFAEKGKFPEAVSFEEGARQRGEQPGDPDERRRYDIEKTRAGMGLSNLTRTGENGAAMVARISMFSDEVMKSSGLWEELMKPGPTVEKLRAAFEKANALHAKEESAPRLTKPQLELMNEAARAKEESGLHPRNREQVLAMLKTAANQMAKDDAPPESQREFEKLIRLYAGGNPEVEKAVHDRLGLRAAGQRPGDKQAAPLPDSSIRDHQADTVPVRDRAARVGRIIENGAIRDLLKKAGLTPDEAKRLEKDLFSDDKKVREKAQADIERAYKGGYKAFFGDAKARLGAAAIVVGAILPEIIEAGSGK